MSDSPVFAKLLSAAAFLALCAYLLSHMNQLTDGGRLTLERVSLRESIRFEGIALRSEQTLCSERELKTVRTSGERIAAGGIVANADGYELVSPVSALFSAETDGYEYLRPPESISAETLDALLSSPPREEKNCIGRLVSGRCWFIAAYADTGEAQIGRRTITVGGTELSARIVSSAPAGDGRSALLMKIKYGKSDLLSLRRCEGEIVQKEFSGFEVPQSAVGTDADGQHFVNILTGPGKEKAPAEILYKDENGKILIAPSDQLKEGVRIARRVSER